MYNVFGLKKKYILAYRKVTAVQEMLVWVKKKKGELVGLRCTINQGSCWLGLCKRQAQLLAKVVQEVGAVVC